MNPLTLVKRIQSINAKESDLGISEEASWHAKYKDSAYVFVGGIPYDLTEGDLLAVFSQYGEVVDVNLVRDKATGKSKGFAFLAYEDQRSTILAVDNLNNAQVLGRTIRVDHCSKYSKHEEENEETRQQKREERGVCRAFQRGECTRGDSCKFSHNEKRAANTGWGHEEDRCSRWDHDKFNGAKKGSTSFGHRGDFKPDEEDKNYREKGHASFGRPREREKVEMEETEPRSRDAYDRREQKRSRLLDDSQSRRRKAENDYTREDKRSRTHDREKLKERSRRDYNDREVKGSSRQSETSMRQDRDSSRSEDCHR